MLHVTYNVSYLTTTCLELLCHQALLIPQLLSYPCNTPWRPIGLWDVEAPTFSGQSAHRWRWDCQPYASATIYPPGKFLVLSHVRGWVDSRAIMRLEGLDELKNAITSPRVEIATFRLVAWCLNMYMCTWYVCVWERDIRRLHNLRTQLK
jgi:hypothetical protein